MAPAAYENVTVLLAMCESITRSMKAPEYTAEQQLVTFLVCNVLVALVSSIFLGLIAIPQVGALLRFIPDKVRHGVFAAIGYGIFLLGFDAFSLKPLDAPSWTVFTNILKWLPAYLLGIGMWAVERRFPSRWLLVSFVFMVCIVAHVGLLMAGIGLEDAAKGKWLLGRVESSSVLDYFVKTYGGSENVNWKAVGASIPSIVT